MQQTNCTYAYSAGDDSTEKFSIFDLRNLDKPVEVDSDPKTAGVQGFTSPTAGHKWNFDDAGFGTHTGFEGASMWSTTNPRAPKLVTTTGLAGQGDDPKYPGWNDFILHNSQRPNAKAFRNGAAPSLANGNILLVTEEDYEQPDCAKAGSFQTWWVKRLDGTRNAIVPLDKVELADLGTFPIPVGRVLLGALVRLPPLRDRRCGLLRRRHPVPRRTQPEGHQVLRSRDVGRLGGLGLLLDAGLLEGRRDDRQEDRTSPTPSTSSAGSTSTGSTCPGTTWDTSTASIAPVGSGWVTGGSAIGVLSALLVAVLLRRRTTSRANLATA